VNLSADQIRSITERVRVALDEHFGLVPNCYNYPDQSIATMTPEQAGEVVESFRMDTAER
jgi:hypothetical protein